MNHLLVFEMNCKLLMEKLVSWYRKLFDTEKAVPLKKINFLSSTFRAQVNPEALDLDTTT